MSRKALAAGGLAAAVLALAPGLAAAATRTVIVGADDSTPNAPAQFEANRFLRKTLTIHSGDTVRWRFRAFHTVTVPASGQAPPPFTVPTGFAVAGANDAAGKPFWFNGTQPLLQPNPQVALATKGSTYTGRAYRNSGLPALPNAKPYRLRFTRAGTYTYFCAVHPGMRGTVRVVARGKRIPSQRQDTAAGDRELAHLVALARATAAEPARGAGIVDVGRAPLGRRFSINAFFPSAISVKAGQQLKFTMAGQNTNEIHTVTLGPVTRAEVPFIAPFSNTINPIAAYPSDPPPGLPPYVGTNHGNGFLNAGLQDANPATTSVPSDTSIAFATPGTYQLKCLVHAGMDATVTVTP